MRVSDSSVMRREAETSATPASVRGPTEGTGQYTGVLGVREVRRVLGVRVIAAPWPGAVRELERGVEIAEAGGQDAGGHHGQAPAERRRYRRRIDGERRRQRPPVQQNRNEAG